MPDLLAPVESRPIDSDRLESMLAPEDKPKGLMILRTFWQLQPGRWYEWMSIWVLKNLRFAPIYILPLLTGKLIDAIDRQNPSKSYGLMWLIMGATIGLCLLNIIGDTLSHMLQSRIARGLTASLRDALIRRLNRISLEFHDRERMGEIETRFTLDMNRIEGFLGFFSDAVLMNASVLIVMSIIICSTNPLLLLVIGVAATANLLLAKSLWARLRGAQEAYRRAEGSFMHRLGETLRGMRITRAHATEEFSEDLLRTDTREVAKRGVALDMLINFFGSSSWAIGTILNSGVVIFGVWLVVSPPHAFSLAGMNIRVQPISIGELTVLLSYYGIMAGSLAAMINQVPAITGAHDALRSMSALFTDEAEISGAGRDPGRIQGHVQLQGISFSYAGAQHPTLQDVDLDIPAGTSLALVGPSGGGKSTIASLILGFYKPHAGTAAVDTCDIASLDLRALRRQMGVVSQDVVLFNDSILSNIAWGDHHPDLDRVLEAARMANAMEFIEQFPRKIHHVLGDRGAGLSGGQRQRLAIARALYRDPRILILDEATSALDNTSEQLVQAALQQAMLGRTSIIIAHRLTTIRGADRIAVIEHGRVVETGTYDELAVAGGVFAKMLGDPPVALKS